jgi:hypothetical protein
MYEMWDVLLKLASLTVYAAVWLFLAFTDYLDWHGRIEVLETKHPKLARLVEGRPLRLVLLLLVLGLLIGDFRETFGQLEAGPVIIRAVFPAPAPPNVATSIKRESRNSLRRRVWRLADEIQRFWTAKRKEAPSPSPNEDQQTTNQKTQKWQIETERECNEKFKEKILELVQELDAKGVDTKIHGWLDYSVILVQNQRCLEGDEWEAFQNLGYRVDAHDNKIEIQF